MLKEALQIISADKPVTTAQAHCDGPCGVYDPASARIAAEAAVSMTKKLLMGDPGAFETMLEKEALSQGVCMSTDDHKEGATAFREKREPNFR